MKKCRNGLRYFTQRHGWAPPHFKLRSSIYAYSRTKFWLCLTSACFSNEGFPAFLGSPADSHKSVFRGKDDVLLLILVPRHVRNKNQSGATFFTGQNSDFGDRKTILVSEPMFLGSRKTIMIKDILISHYFVTKPCYLMRYWINRVKYL